MFPPPLQGAMRFSVDRALDHTAAPVSRIAWSSRMSLHAPAFASLLAGRTHDVDRPAAELFYLPCLACSVIWRDAITGRLQQGFGSAIPPMAPMSYVTMMSEQSAGDLTSIWL